MSDHITTYNLPLDVAEELLCSCCENFVSCSPVKVLLDGSSICGRCSSSGSTEHIENLLFETAMKKFKFPCRFEPQGCSQYVLFDKAAEHENACLYRTFPCPSLPQGICSRNVSAFDVNKHFEEHHADLIIKDEKFKLNVEENCQCNLLIVKDDMTAAVRFSYDASQKTLVWNIEHFQRYVEQKVYYEMQMISTTNENCTLLLEKTPCEPYKLPITEQNITTFVLSSHLPVLNNPADIFIKILLTGSNQSLPKISPLATKEHSLEASTSSQSQVNAEEHKEAVRNAWDLLEKVRCMHCNYFVSPPVYEVTTSSLEPIWSIPGTSPYVTHYVYPRRKLSEAGRSANEITTKVYCSNCKSKATGYNAVVEKGYKGLNFPCLWRGCTFMGNESNIKMHTQNCQFRTYICPVATTCSTGYFNSNNLMEHMLQHGTFYPDPTNFVIKLFSQNAASIKTTYFTVFENKVAAFTCNITKSNEWTLEGNFNGLSADVYFEHDHCNMKTKTFVYSNTFSLKSEKSKPTQTVLSRIQQRRLYNVECTESIDSNFPSCFKFCKRVEVIISIRKI